EKISAWPNGRGDKIETAISGERPGPATKGYKGFTSSRVEEEVDAENCPCGKAIESRSHIVAKCELYTEERDVLQEEMRDVTEGGMSSFDALGSSEKTMAILGDIW
ncbi:unnamed protein product, partial [Sphacelaria rigidula]